MPRSLAHMTARCIARPFGAAAALSLLAGLAVAKGPTIADIAPAESMLVVSVADWTTLKAQFDRTGMKTLWSTNEVQALVKELAKETAEEFEGMLSEVGLTKEDMVYPSGNIGMAVTFAKPLSEVAAQIGTLEGELDTDALFVADYGDNADKFSELLEKLYDIASEKHGAEIRQTPYGEHSITSVIHPAEEEAEGEGDQDEDDLDDFDIPGVGMLMPFEGENGPSGFHVVRLDSTYIICDSMETLEASIDRAGDPGRPSVGEDTVYIKSMAQHPDDSGATIFFRAGEAIRLFTSQMTLEQRQWDEAAPDMAVIFDALGLLGVQSASFGVRLDTADAMAETTVGILAPEKKGILSLFMRGAPSFQTPAFIPADASSLTQLVIDFSKIPEIARGVIDSLPDEVKEQANMAYAQAEPLVLPVIAALGPDVYIAQTIAQPLAVDSQKTVVALRLTDPLVISNLASTFGAQIGLVAREFQGAQIFEQADVGMGAGISAEWLFIGQIPLVEDALRRAGAPGDDLLSGQDNFKAAAAFLQGDAVVSQFQDTERTIRYMLWSIQNADKIADAQLDALEIDEEFKQQIREARGAEQRDWVRLLPPPELITQHIGDSAGEIRPTPDGYRGRTVMLRPKS